MRHGRPLLSATGRRRRHCLPHGQGQAGQRERARVCVCVWCVSMRARVCVCVYVCVVCVVMVVGHSRRGPAARSCAAGVRALLPAQSAPAKATSRGPVPVTRGHDRPIGASRLLQREPAGTRVAPSRLASVARGSSSGRHCGGGLCAETLAPVLKLKQA